MVSSSEVSTGLDGLTRFPPPVPAFTSHSSVPAQRWPQHPKPFVMRVTGTRLQNIYFFSYCAMVAPCMHLTWLPSSWTYCHPLSQAGCLHALPYSNSPSGYNCRESAAEGCCDPGAVPLHQDQVCVRCWEIKPRAGASFPVTLSLCPRQGWPSLVWHPSIALGSGAWKFSGFKEGRMNRNILLGAAQIMISFPLRQGCDEYLV